MKNDEKAYDFDAHTRNTYMYFWIREYMDATYQACKNSGYNFKGKTVYDIGIGRGRSLAMFKTLKIVKVIGFDIRKSELAYAKKQIKRMNLDVKLVLDTPNNAILKKVPTSSCEIVTLMNIIFCLPNDEVRNTVISEAKRILKPGGILIVLDMQKPSLMWLMSRITFKHEWRFLTRNQFMKVMKPLKLIAYKESNYLYFINIIMNLLGSIFTPKVYVVTNNFCKALRIPPSTRSFVFKK